MARSDTTWRDVDDVRGRCFGRRGPEGDAPQCRGSDGDASERRVPGHRRPFRLQALAQALARVSALSRARVQALPRARVSALFPARVPALFRARVSAQCRCPAPAPARVPVHALTLLVACLLGITLGVTQAEAPAAMVVPLYRLHIIPHSDDPADQAVKGVAQRAVVDYLAHHGPPSLGSDLGFTAAWLHRQRPALEAVVTAALAADHGAGEEFVPAPSEGKAAAAPMPAVASSPAVAGSADVPAVASSLAADRSVGGDQVRVINGYFWFDSRQLGAVTIPAGLYPATRIVLGAGRGGNWWCALYQGLCVAGAWTDDDSLQQAVAAMALNDGAAPDPQVAVTFRWFAKDWWQQRQPDPTALGRFWRLWLQVAQGSAVTPAAPPQPQP